MRKAIVTLAIPFVLSAGSLLAEPDENSVCEGRYQVRFTDTFEDGENLGGWRYGIPFPFIPVGETFPVERGGTSKAFLGGRVESYAPTVMTMKGGPFIGNWREMGVRSLSVQFRIFHAAFATTEERPVTLVLTRIGNPHDPTDDQHVLLIGKKNIPRAGVRNPSGRFDPDRQSGWVHYTFKIPSDSPTLPLPRSPKPLHEATIHPGWDAAEGLEVLPMPEDPDAVWNDVIESVDRVAFTFHDPRLFALLQGMVIGMDNASITMCYE